jgi:mannose-6-phosphate isomerase
VADLHAVTDVRPWGSFVLLGVPDEEPIAAVKVLNVDPGQRLSLQTHELRRERWIPTSPGLGAVIGEHDFLLEVGITYEVPVGVPHRLYDKGGAGGTVIEIMFGVYDENDIKRLQDSYGR